MQERFRQSICWILRLFWLHVGRFKALHFSGIRLFCRCSVFRRGSVQFAVLVSGYQSHECDAYQSKSHQSKFVRFITHLVVHAKWYKQFQFNIKQHKYVQKNFYPWIIPDFCLLWGSIGPPKLCGSLVHTFLFLTGTSLQTAASEGSGSSYWLRAARARRWLVQTRDWLQFELCFCYYLMFRRYL